MSAALHRPAAAHASTNLKTKQSVPIQPVQPQATRSASETGSRPEPDTMTAVNRKKQKRRQKQAARLAAEQQDQNGDLSPNLPEQTHYDKDQSDLDDGDLEDHDDIDDEDARDDRDSNPGPMTNGNGTTKTSKSKKKKKSKTRSASQTLADESSTSLSAPSATTSRSQPPLPSLPTSQSVKKPKDRIWNTSTQEERENIKKFWLELGEDERRALVKVEKDAVLKKMKEQQKHSCSCTVCGRKRTAIEEELEVLYDAYYEELEQYANNNQGTFENGAPIIPPPRLYHHNLHSLDHRHTHTHTHTHSHPHSHSHSHSHSHHAHHMHHHHPPSHGRVHELPEDEEDLEDDYDEEDEEEEEPYSDDELDDDSRDERADFFAFGNSLTVKDGILTVADDLLKNDGKHFIDMMEQLAERRMQREEDTQYGMVAAHQSYHAGHNHGPLDEEEYDEEEEEDYDSQEEEDYDDDEMDTMTEEQRMEEGRRMFQIFAARMFEQRVLTAYREKVAQQRQELLLQELLEEENLNEQRSAKKAREAQKKKDKKKQQKQAKEEEKARRDAEKAAEEAAVRAREEKKLEEQKRKKEELRRKKEAEKKAQEEERLRKEAEKQKRLQEERERQAEIDRKQREQKERERKKREDAKRKEREERESKDKELRDKKAKEEHDRKLREEQASRDLGPGSKPEPTGKERSQSQPSSQPATIVPKRTSQPAPAGAFIPPGFQSPQHGPVTSSPHFQIATPILQKASTPARPRQPSQHGSHASSPHSQAAGGSETLSSLSPQTLPLSHPSSTPISSSGKLGLSQQPVLHHPQPSAPLSPLGGAGRSHPLGYSAVNGLPSHPPPGMSGVAPRPIGNENMAMYPPHSGPIGSQYRGFAAPNGVILPPGIGGSRPIPAPNRGFPPLDPSHNLAFGGHAPGPGVNPTAQSTGRSAAHSRQASGSFDRPSVEGQPTNAPISRPTPIKRLSSPHKGEGKSSNLDVDGLSAQLGSSALLDDSDVPFPTSLSQSLPGAPLPTGFGLSRASFGAPPFPDPLSPAKHPSFSGQGNTWASQSPFGVPFATSWNTASGGTWPNRPFGAGGNHRTHASRPVAIRLLAIQAIKHLNSLSPSKLAPGFHEVNRLLRQVEQLKSPNEPPIALNEMIDIFDTEGSSQNGGGSFIIKEDGSGSRYVKFEQDSTSPLSNHRGGFVPGDIGSPVPANSMPAPFGGIGTAPGVRQFSSPTGF